MDSHDHMVAGISLMEQGNWPAALGHFENAVRLRDAGEWRGNPYAAWRLAASWINFSDALRRTGRTAEAPAALDHAIEAMAHVPLDDHPQYPDRLILAWLNRAEANVESDRTDDALSDFETAADLLEAWSESPPIRRRVLRAMLHANRARILLALDRADDGWRDARAAVDALTGIPLDREIAAVAIQVRVILCRALATLLEEPDAADLESDWIATATDTAEEALVLARSTGANDPWIAELVIYTTRIYRTCQPHFLGDFLADFAPLVVDPTSRRELLGELRIACRDLELRVRQRSHDTGLVDNAIRSLRSLQQAESLLISDSMNDLN